MEWFLKWGLRIAGIIIIAAVLDIVMLEGNIKKYIRPTLGVLLILAIIKPIWGEGKNLIKTEFILNSSQQFNGLTADFEKINQSNILKLYEKRLADNMKECLKKRYGNDFAVTVKANDESLTGNIKSVEIEVKTKDGVYVNTEEFKSYIENEFGVLKTDIKVFLTEAG